MSHSRRRHLCSFIWVGMSTSFVLIASIILSGCGTPTPTSQPNPTESPPTPSPSPTPPPGSTGNPPLSLPDMYFVIDESESMMAKDPAGEPCDLAGLRYDIPLFMARILKNWGNQGIANDPNIYLLLEEEQKTAQIPSPITPDLMIEKLQNRLSNPPKGNPPKGDVQPFDAAKNPDALQAIFDAAKDNDYVFLFTDGDFRKSRPLDDPYNSDANSTSVKVAGLFENNRQHPKTFAFLLCTRRIESQENWFITRTWEDLEDLDENQQVIAYGLESPDLSDKEILGDSISKMLSDWLGDWNNRSENGYVTHGWGWLNNGNLSTIGNITPDLLRLRYGAISFDTGILTTKVQVDGNPIPELDTGFPEHIDDFFPPTGQCHPHSLEFDQSALIDHTFYWWWGDVPKLFAETTQPFVLYNNESKNYSFSVRVGSSLMESEFLKPNDLNEFSRCLEFQVVLGNNPFPLKYQEDETLLLENLSNPFPNENQPLPNGNGIVPLTVQGVWYSDGQQLFSLPIQSEETAKIRYYPVIGNRVPLSVTPTPSGSQEIKLQIPLDFFEEKYYPPSIFGEQSSWQPTVKFDGGGCPLGLTTPVRPPYLPTPGGLAPIFDVKIIQVGESGLEITIIMDSIDNLKKCDKLTLSWDKWPNGIEDLQAPPKIELTCTLITSSLVCQ